MLIGCLRGLVLRVNGEGTNASDVSGLQSAAHSVLK